MIWEQNQVWLKVCLFFGILWAKQFPLMHFARERGLFQNKLNLQGLNIREVELHLGRL